MVLSHFLIFSLLFSTQLRIPRKDLPQGRPFEFKRPVVFKNFPKVDVRRLRKRLLDHPGVDTIRILAIRVEFQEDDDPRTTGNGKFDLIGYRSIEESGLDSDPPHTKKYFEGLMTYLHNYYKVNSRGKLYVDFQIMPYGLLETYTVPHTIGYYGDTLYWDYGLCRLMKDALLEADKDTISDFDRYDAVIIFHAGSSYQTSYIYGRDLDIPAVTVPQGALEYYLGRPYILLNEGKDTVDLGIIMPEMARVDSVMFGVQGMLVHEFGHILGHFDLYDVTGYSCGVGAWSIMGTGGWVGMRSIGVPEGTITPLHDPWFRGVFYDWDSVLTVSDPESLVSLMRAEIDTSLFPINRRTIIKVPISPTEYFLIENRQQDVKHKDTIIVEVEDGVPIYVDEAEYDFFLPGSGILIWHVDERVIWENYEYNEVQINPLHKGIDVEEADGLQHFDGWFYGDTLEYYGSRFDPFFIGGNNHFGPFTRPSSESYYGKALIRVEVQSRPDTIMDLRFTFDLYQPGFPIELPGNHKVTGIRSGDLDHDRRPEVIVAVENGSIYVFRSDGTGYLNPSGYFGSMRDSLRRPPAVADLDGDGRDEVVALVDFELKAFDDTGGVMTGFPVTIPTEVFVSPLVFDIDGDGHNEIVFGGADRKVYIYRDDGTLFPKFPVALSAEIYANPVVYDYEQRLVAVVAADGCLYFIDKGGIKGKNGAVPASVAITRNDFLVEDFDRDGKNEVFIAQGNGDLYLADTDSIKEGWPIRITLKDTFFPAALGDPDHDGFLEIFVIGTDRIYGLNPNGSYLTGFPLLSDTLVAPPLVIGDMDGKGYILSGGPFLSIKSSRNDSHLYSPLFGFGGFSSPGILLDLDLDNDYELISGSDSGVVYGWDLPITSVHWSGEADRYEGEIFTHKRQPSGIISRFYLYPNPVQGKGVIRFRLNESADVEVMILDIMGRRCSDDIRVDGLMVGEECRKVLDFSNLSPGVYIARIQAKSSKKTETHFFRFAVR
ncbi:MAG TPA: T9SS type A sorting domain-containing protein [bacterium (Candidatus Stahlbacteria)]|nr:T9SS type A sorting domain-containing protein [Candidatus Stahlbacteria bacterium]